jgi:CRISPR-associated protein Csm1
MEELEKIIQKAALLHDIGKVCLRADPGLGNHSKAGVEFLKPYFAKRGDAVLRAVGHHHSGDIKSVHDDSDISYIVYEADNLAAGTDRRDVKNDTKGFDRVANLESVFNVFGDTDKTKTAYYLRGLMKEEGMLYPRNKEDIQAPASLYKEIVADIKDNFDRRSPADMEVNELLQILEATMTYIPSSTAVNQPADISLYDHMKLTAAFAGAMYRWFKAEGIVDYKKYCLEGKQKEIREQEMYLLVSGDISGIQNFIYTIPSKGALKSLRGRSFYLEILTEHVVDELLERIGLSRANLLYTGGGHFYLLLPNTEDLINHLKTFENLLNEWFLHHFGNRLYIALGWSAFSAHEIAATGPGIGEVYRRVGKVLSERKLRRYSKEQLTAMFDWNSELNSVGDGTRECSVCHTSSNSELLRPYVLGDDGALACNSCNALAQLGQEVLNKDVFIITDATEAGIELPGFGEKRYLEAVTPAEAERRDDLARIYVKNEVWTGEKMATRLWVGDYSVRKEDGTGCLEFSELAELSGGGKDDTGIERIGVLRADVDNLGAAFVAGISRDFMTVTRTAVLSHQLSVFFKRYINELCAGKVNGINEKEYTQFSLFNREKNKKRNVHIVYSGGDDMFIVGAWDDLIELAVDIRRTFRRFTNDKLTFSAGIGLFKSAFPVSQMARIAGDLESHSKKNEGKDSITLFGAAADDGPYSRPVAYKWDVFTENVCGQKLEFLQRCFYFDEKKPEEHKLFIGKGGLYRLMQLMADCEAKCINIARIAYTLGRMEPKDHRKMTAYKEVRENIYKWSLNESDRSALITAIQLLVYSLRA